MHRSKAGKAQPPGTRKKPPVSNKKVALALQGGGSHGAFTWGVLDRLLEEPSLEIEALTGTSAGAMNAVLVADGLRRGGPGEARAALRRYWERLGKMPGLASLMGPKPPWAPKWSFDDNPMFLWLDMLTRVWSPYDLNPFDYQPLKELLAEIDFKGLRGDPKAPTVFICATDVRTGRRRIFNNAELTADAVLASACLPNMFRAIEIDGAALWDGGYTGNPALAPIYVRSKASDLLVVGINPMVREHVPRTARDIIDRINEISFNSTFILELAAIAFIHELLDSEAIEPTRYRRLLIHGIQADELVALGASSKYNNDPEFLNHLFSIGHRSGADWIAANLDAVGTRSTVDLSVLIPFREEFHAQPSFQPAPSARR
jgi:NTE family protein